MYSHQVMKTNVFKTDLVTGPYLYIMTWNIESDILQYI